MNHCYQFCWPTKLPIFWIKLSSSVATLLPISEYRLLSSMKHNITNEFMVSDVDVSPVILIAPEPNNEPSLLSLRMSRMAYWWICSPRYSIASHIRHRTDRGVHYLTNLHHHSSHLVNWVHSNRDRTIHETLAAQIVYGWRQFEPWSLTKTIHRRVDTGSIKISSFSLDIEFHVLFLNRHRY